MVEARLKSKYLYKYELLLLKVIPMIMAGMYLINTILSYFNIDLIIFSIIGGISLLPLLFLYLSSYVFRFCGYHRMFLHYIVLNDLICWIDYKFDIPVTDLQYLMIHLIVAGICLFIILYLKLHGHDISKVSLKDVKGCG